MNLNLCINEFCYPDCTDWIMFGLGVAVSIGWLFVLYRFFTSKLEIGIPVIEKINNRSTIKVPIKNQSNRFEATRILVEIAVVDENNFTYHFKTDSTDFAFIPSKRRNKDNVRVFKTIGVSDFLTEYYQYNLNDIMNRLEENNSLLRVRIHSTNSISGLGKTEESEFEFSNHQFRIKK